MKNQELSDITIDKYLLSMAEGVFPARKVYNYGDDVFRSNTILDENMCYDLFITCDGTSSVSDAVRNLLVMRNNRSDCAKGFYDPAKGFYDHFGKNILSCPNRVYIGGKSRGGAIALELARRIMKYENISVHCCSFGAPMAGGVDWCRETEDLIKKTGSTFRIYEAKMDPVVKLPFRFMGFRKLDAPIIKIPRYNGPIQTHLYAYRNYFIRK